MKIQIKATGIELTPAIRDYVEKKLESLEKFIRTETETALAEVEVGTVNKHHKSGDIFRAELNLTMGGEKIYVHAEKDDLYAAIDEMRDISERELTASKDKKLTLAKRGAAKIKNLLKK